MPRPLPSSTIFTNRSSRLAIVLITAVLFQASVVVVSEADASSPNTAEGASVHSLAIGQPSLLYPSEALAELANRSQLAETVFTDLGLSSNLTNNGVYLPSGSILICRKPPRSDFFDGFLQGYTLDSFVNDQGVRIDLYYSSSSNGLLLAADVILGNTELLKADKAFQSSSFDFAVSLGIPINSTSSVSFVNASGRSTVIFSSTAGGADIIGSNLVAFEFSGTSGALLEIQFRPFVGFADPTVKSDSVISLASETALEKTISDKDLMLRERVSGLRLVVIDAPAPSGNSTNSTPPELRMAWEYQADFRTEAQGTQNYSVLVLVDSQTGSVLFATRSPVVVPTDHVLINVPIFGIALVAAAVLIVAFVFVSPEFAWVVVFLFAVLFMRLRGADILDNFNRGRIMGYISAKPGASFTDIRDSLKMANGGLAYHLSVLQKLELVTSTRDGRARRFYPIGKSAAQGDTHFLGTTESEILEQLEKNGPLSNAALAELLSMSRQRIHYNLRLLEGRGLVDREGVLWRVSPARLNKYSGAVNLESNAAK